MAKISPYESGDLTDSIFLILLATKNPVHGYRIMQVIQEMTAGEVEIGPATMYTTLKKLCAAKWITAIEESDSKIIYQITEEGKKILIRNYENRKKIVGIASNYMEEEEI